jgi:hypothetical protein
MITAASGRITQRHFLQKSNHPQKCFEACCVLNTEAATRSR